MVVLDRSGGRLFILSVLVLSKSQVESLLTDAYPSLRFSARNNVSSRFSSRSAVRWPFNSMHCGSRRAVPRRIVTFLMIICSMRVSVWYQELNGRSSDVDP